MRRGWLAVAFACACSGPRDPILQLLDDLERTAEQRDAAAFMSRLSERFQGAERLDRSAAAALLRRQFAAYESIALEVYGVEVSPGQAAARVRCWVEFSGRGRQAFGLQGLLPAEAAYRFELDLAEEEGTWRVLAASWEEVRASGP